MDLVEYLRDEWTVIYNAPVTFILGAIVISSLASGLVYWLVRVRFARRLAARQKRILLRNDQIADLRDKLKRVLAAQKEALVDDILQSGIIVGLGIQFAPRFERGLWIFDRIESHGKFDQEKPFQFRGESYKIEEVRYAHENGPGEGFTLGNVTVRHLGADHPD